MMSTIYRCDRLKKSEAGVQTASGNRAVQGVKEEGTRVFYGKKELV
jgi:hypothetical protein